MSFPKDIAAVYVYDKLDVSLRDALGIYQKYLGTVVAGIAHTSGVVFTEPVYANTNNYTRTGEQIILVPDTEYYTKFPQDKTDKLTNHYQQTYLYLAGKYGKKNDRIH